MPHLNRSIVLALSVALAACSGVEAIKRDQNSLPSIVSLNPCTDAILAEIADPAQILAISHYSHDASASSMDLATARKIPAISGSVEEVVALHPDIVVAGGHVGPATVDALDRLGIRLVQAPVANSVADSHAGVRTIASAIGRVTQGEALVRRIDAALAKAAPTSSAKPVPALVWQGGGLVPGQGTLVDDLLTRTGFANSSQAFGLAQWDILGLEPMLAAPPRVLFSPQGSRARDDRMLGHPALAELRGTMKMAEFPPNLLFCGGPTIIRAAERLADVRRGLVG